MFMARIEKDADNASSNQASLVPQIWPVITAVMMAEVHRSATEEQARGFFHSLGGRIAAMVSVDDIQGLDSLCERINMLWAQLGFGNVEMTLDDDGIDLRHSDAPHMPPPDNDDLWSTMVGPLLEGAYDSWFRTLGSSASLRTRVVKEGEGCIELRHAS